MAQCVEHEALHIDKNLLMLKGAEGVSCFLVL